MVASSSESTEMIDGGPRGIPLTLNFFGFLKFGIELSWTRISFMAQAGPVMVAGGIEYSKKKGVGAELGVGIEGGSGIYVSANQRDGIVIHTPFGEKRLLIGNTDSNRNEELKRAANEEKRRKEELAAIKERLSKVEAENEKMKTANKAYINFLKDLNSSGKRIEDGHCLVIFGLVDIDNDVRSDVVFILRKLNPSLKQSDLDFAFRFGVYEKRTQRPVIVQFSDKLVRQIVLDNTRKLTDSGVEVKEDVQINVFYD